MSFGNRFENATPSEGRTRELVPNGWYPAYLTETKMMANNSGWEGVNVEATINGGKYDGKKVFHNFTIAMTNHEKADEIASDGMDGFVGLLDASGHPTPKDPDAHPIGGRLVGINIYQKKQKGGDNDGQMKNDFSAWCPVDEIANKPAPDASSGGGSGKKAAGKSSSFSRAAAKKTSAKEDVQKGTKEDFNDDIPF